MVEGDVIKASYIVKMDLCADGSIVPARDHKGRILPDSVLKNHEFIINKIYKNGVVELTTYDRFDQWFCYTTVKDIKQYGENLLLYAKRKVV